MTTGMVQPAIPRAQRVVFFSISGGFGSGGKGRGQLKKNVFGLPIPNDFQN